MRSCCGNSSTHNIEALADGDNVVLTFKTVAEEGVPNLDLFFNNGDTQHGTMIVDKGDKTITFRLDADGNVITDIVTGEF